MFKWIDDNGDLRVGRAALDIAISVIVVCLFVTAIDAAFWGGSVVLAPIFGAGEARKQIEGPENRIYSQESFVQRYESIQAFPAKIRVAEQELNTFIKDNEGNSDPIGSLSQERSRLRTNVTGLKNLCIQAVADYNAEVQKASKEQFRPKDLPSRLESATYCGGE